MRNGLAQYIRRLNQIAMLVPKEGASHKWKMLKNTSSQVLGPVKKLNYFQNSQSNKLCEVFLEDQLRCKAP